MKYTRLAALGATALLALGGVAVAPAAALAAAPVGIAPAATALLLAPTITSVQAGKEYAAVNSPSSIAGKIQGAPMRGETVRFTINGGKRYEVPVRADGSWSLTFADPFRVGSYTVTAWRYAPSTTGQSCTTSPQGWTECKPAGQQISGDSVKLTFSVQRPVQPSVPHVAVKAATGQSTARVAVAGTAPAGHRVTVTGTPKGTLTTTAGPDGAWKVEAADFKIGTTTVSVTQSVNGMTSLPQTAKVTVSR